MCGLCGWVCVVGVKFFVSAPPPPIARTPAPSKTKTSRHAVKSLATHPRFRPDPLARKIPRPEFRPDRFPSKPPSNPTTKNSKPHSDLSASIVRSEARNLTFLLVRREVSGLRVWPPWGSRYQDRPYLLDLWGVIFSRFRTFSKFNAVVEPLHSSLTWDCSCGSHYKEVLHN